jgi:hypothetical protein
MAAASRAGVLAGRDLDGYPRDVVGERAASWALLVLRSLLGQAQLAHDGGGRHLARLERQLKLLGALARGPEPVRLVARQLVPKRLDQHRLRLLGDQKPCERPQVLGVLGQGHGFIEHGRS